VSADKVLWIYNTLFAISNRQEKAKSVPLLFIVKYQGDIKKDKESGLILARLWCMAGMCALNWCWLLVGAGLVMMPAGSGSCRNKS